MLNASLYEIMIIDDISENLDFLNKLLIEHKFKTRPFKSAKVALQSSQHKPPDLILVDINMPEMDGYEFCERIKKINTLKEIPIIFISALHEEASKVAAFECGGVDYITKPFKLAEVIARVETHLKIRAYQIEIENKNQELSETLNELKNTQTQLIHSEKIASLGIMASGIAHEINNPINSINGNSQALKEIVKKFINIWHQVLALDSKKLKISLDEFREECKKNGYNEIVEDSDLIVDNIINASHRASNIVRDLLIFVRADTVEVQPTDINNCIDSTYNILFKKEKDNVKIIKEYGDLPEVFTNPSKLNQVLLNLLLNAIDSFEDASIEKEKTIIVKTLVKKLNNETKISIIVSDNGSGINGENLKNIFDPFFTTKEVGKGTGLGLSICKGLVESLDGTIEAYSKLNKGTTFEVLLPYNKA